ncbi:MAG TPA: peptidoglycan bridge formation glycyltransferase FemA/FemB family protein [Candidatus Limnocylindrales bacterium]
MEAPKGMPERVSVPKVDGRSSAHIGTSVVDLAPDPAAWDAFVARCDPGSYLQTTAWAEVKRPNGWTPLRFMGTTLPGRAAHGSGASVAAEALKDAALTETRPVPDGLALDLEDLDLVDHLEEERSVPETEFGVQLLVRRPRLFPWAFAYAPRGPVLGRWDLPTLEAFTAAVQTALASHPGKVSHVRIEPEIELDGPADLDGTLRHGLRHCGWRPGTPIQTTRTRRIDLKASEEALWGDLRKKWRQYANKARKGGIRVVDASENRLPEFYSIYQDTAKRAGFVIRTYESYLQTWQAFSKLGMARLLFAEDPSGKGLATLFVLRVGDRVIEPWGGMTQEGADSRANYLLKWEAIRTSREQGAHSYDMWGLSHEGIEYFKSGFGGREITFVGAWDLVLDPAGRLAFDSAQAALDRIGRWRQGVRGRGRPGSGESGA